MPLDKYENYDTSVDDSVIGSFEEINIKPDFYIHKVLLKCQEALAKDDARTGFLQFSLLVNHLECLCNAGKMLKVERVNEDDTEDTYEEKIKKFKQKEDYKSESDSITQKVLLANYKLELILTEIFQHRAITEPLKL